LRVVRQLSGSLKRMGVGENGTALFWDDTTTVERLLKRDPLVSGANDWTVPIPGIMNADPVIDVGGRVVWASMWQLINRVGDVVAFEFNLDNGALVNGAPVILRQDFGQDSVDSALRPKGTFNANGSILYLTVLNDAGGPHTTVIGCATNTSCDVNGGGRKFSTKNFDGEFSLVLPFSAGNLLAIVGPAAVWFVDAEKGVVRNLSERAIAPSSTGLQILSVYPGTEKAFYVLAGPPSTTKRTFPTEAIAVDAPENGELYRFTFGSGESPASAIAMGVDDNGQAWFRVGADQVKPLTLLEYRSARGTTVIP
jgi:hypothetical protein